MPTVNVPLKGRPGWDELMRKRRAFWRQAGKNQTDRELHRPANLNATTGRPARSTPDRRMVKLCNVFLEPMRAKFGTAYVLSGYRQSCTTGRLAELATRNNV